MLRLKSFCTEFLLPPSVVISRSSSSNSSSSNSSSSSKQQQQQQQRPLFYGLTLAAFARAVEAELFAFEGYLVNEVYIHLNCCGSPLLLLAAVRRWQPLLLLLARLCGLDFPCSSSSNNNSSNDSNSSSSSNSNSSSSSNSRVLWRFPRGTALLSRLMTACAALQHLRRAPLLQQQQQQQQVYGGEAALALRLLEASAPAFLHTLSRCCFAVRV